ncbi:M64 family metallopeptidase [Sporocytophaga myxococcoides]|uniref:M64 family metallopeptidase n=1 Tax=Sporocytophaga myxococcoides TaxID=153721 RepID=UPI00138AADD2|nr:M64 family metallopeptidase [Sporocytophaga myxococcoides]
MKKIKLIAISLVILLFVANPVFAQVFDVDTLLYNGNTNKNINLVILGDGYVSSEMNDFITDANKLKNYLFGKAPFSNYKNYFNVFIIKTPSIESGVKHPATAADCISASVPKSNPNNYFGSTFDAYGIHRLVVPMNTSAIISVLADNFPDYDQVFVIANSLYYGGSGGSYATATLDQWSNEIAVHEIGHSFAGLADEYWAGPGYAAEKPNMTQNNNPNTIKWKNWLNTGTGVGIFQFSGQAWYKPANGTCIMEEFNKPFCAVCNEAIIEKIHQLVSPIKNYTPISSINTITDPVYFSLSLIKPIPNTLKTEWLLNGINIGKNVDSVLINPSSLNFGSNSISVSVIDTTNLIRNNGHTTSHLYVTNWTISKSVTGIHTISSKNNMLEVKLYPNPSSDFLNIIFKNEKQEKASIHIFSSQGTLVQSIENPNKADNNISLTVDLSKYAVGSYFVEFRSVNFVHTESFIKL